MERLVVAGTAAGEMNECSFRDAGGSAADPLPTTSRDRSSHDDGKGRHSLANYPEVGGSAAE